MVKKLVLCSLGAAFVAGAAFATYMLVEEKKKKEARLANEELIDVCSCEKCEKTTEVLDKGE